VRRRPHAAHDIPITAYLFDGHSWSRAGSSAVNTWFYDAPARRLVVKIVP
jgi:hypothetical protein